MLKTIVASTYEIDDVELAVSEILEQINKECLCKSSVGLLTCFSEFIDSGVVKALCDELPFDILGCTTIGNSINGQMGDMMLTLMVLTGDDVEFSTGFSESLSEEYHGPLDKAYNSALVQLDSKPVMMITFAPLLFNVSGDMMIESLDRISSGLPNFGTITVDHNEGNYRDAQVIYNGNTTRDQLAMLLISGNVNPEFYVVSISKDKVLKQDAIITESEGNILKKVNGISVLKYMESLGLTKDGHLDGANAIPLVIDYNDSTMPVSRAMFAINPEGYGICGGVMPVNSTLSVGAIDHDDVIETTKRVIEDVLENYSNKNLIMFSCIGRNFALGLESMGEMQAVENMVGDKVKYQLTYSGGEICPMRNENGKYINRSHNNTLAICLI